MIISIKKSFFDCISVLVLSNALLLPLISATLEHI